ncbi:hypothetical protein CAOG_00564 [Capsaspora owczarzaki ATCC 30864]|uniref:UDENN domain-containing protein n=1 Tax=Capsaspora owczarzaki (strain ATCC 30864) TaxID=595528 RepID=A0A0D2VGJ8_CAPO3|nr:hypothetical protein CAOG_00564 [Capsaspora owczarzaki ATCC 30864]KJE89002.1 hypothetical protein CAOG_000564 [Capsaspora owczarzaki ATCC 30864]|eukprot:XP_004365435.2 hypothetical protein CAOG_00564 [Capsaspora owczarzaki ATCC 30864]
MDPLPTRIAQADSKLQMDPASELAAALDRPTARGDWAEPSGAADVADAAADGAATATAADLLHLLPLEAKIVDTILLFNSVSKDDGTFDTFPEIDSPDWKSFIETVPLFCFPSESWLVEQPATPFARGSQATMPAVVRGRSVSDESSGSASNATAAREPYFRSHSFVLTDALGCHRYGVCTVLLTPTGQPVTDHTRTQRAHQRASNQSTQSAPDALESASIGQLRRTSRGRKSLSLPSTMLQTALNYADPVISRFPDVPGCTWRAVALLSRLPLFDSLFKISRSLLGIWSDTPEELDNWCLHLTYSLPTPPVGGLSVEFQVGSELVSVSRPASRRLVDVDTSVLLSTLSPSSILQVYGSLLLEKSVILHSTNLEALTATCESFRSLLFPFEWEHVYIPILPPSLLLVVQSPAPFFLGMHTDAFLECSDEIDEGVVVVDLEADIIRNGATLGRNHHLKLLKLLQQAQQRRFEERYDTPRPRRSAVALADVAPGESIQPASKRGADETVHSLLLDAFAMFGWRFAAAIACYHDDSTSELDVIALCAAHPELDSKFVESFCETSAYFRLLDNSRLRARLGSSPLRAPEWTSARAHLALKVPPPVSSATEGYHSRLLGKRFLQLSSSLLPLFLWKPTEFLVEFLTVAIDRQHSQLQLQGALTATFDATLCDLVMMRASALFSMKLYACAVQDILILLELCRPKPQQSEQPQQKEPSQPPFHSTVLRDCIHIIKEDVPPELVHKLHPALWELLNSSSTAIAPPSATELMVHPFCAHATGSHSSRNSAIDPSLSNDSYLSSTEKGALQQQQALADRPKLASAQSTVDAALVQDIAMRRPSVALTSATMRRRMSIAPQSLIPTSARRLYKQPTQAEPTEASKQPASPVGSPADSNRLLILNATSSAAKSRPLPLLPGRVLESNGFQVLQQGMRTRASVTAHSIISPATSVSSLSAASSEEDLLPPLDHLSALELSIQMLEILAELFRIIGHTEATGFVVSDPSRVALISYTSAFQNFARFAEQLSTVQIHKVFASIEEKLCFFLNIRSALLMHAVLELGGPTYRHQWQFLYSIARYQLGGRLYSVADIDETILRYSDPLTSAPLASTGKSKTTTTTPPLRRGLSRGVRQMSVRTRSRATDLDEFVSPNGSKSNLCEPSQASPHQATSQPSNPVQGGASSAKTRQQQLVNSLTPSQLISQDLALHENFRFISFACFNGTNSSPFVQIYKPDTVWEQLRMGAVLFVNEQVSVLSPSVVLPVHFRWYFDDFGEQKKDIVNWLLSLPESQAAVALSTLSAAERRRLSIEIRKPAWHFRLHWLELDPLSPNAPALQTLRVKVHTGGDRCNFDLEQCALSIQLQGDRDQLTPYVALEENGDAASFTIGSSTSFKILVPSHVSVGSIVKARLRVSSRPRAVQARPRRGNTTPDATQVLGPEGRSGAGALATNDREEDDVAELFDLSATDLWWLPSSVSIGLDLDTTPQTLLVNEQVMDGVTRDVSFSPLRIFEVTLHTAHSQSVNVSASVQFVGAHGFSAPYRVTPGSASNYMKFTGESPTMFIIDTPAPIGDLTGIKLRIDGFSLFSSRKWKLDRIEVYEPLALSTRIFITNHVVRLDDENNWVLFS